MSLLKTLDKNKNPKRYKKIAKMIDNFKSESNGSDATISADKMGGAITYASYIARFIANIIDYAIYMAILISYGYIIGILNYYSKISVSIALLIGLIILQGLYTAGYQVFFHKQWGQTIGKMLTRIKVIQLNGKNLTWESAFLRSSISILLLLLLYIGIMMGFLLLSQNEIFSYSYQDLYKVIFRKAPIIFSIIPKLMSIWSISEVVVMFFNPKRRAPQDFIAGTVVVKKNLNAKYRFKRGLRK